MNKSTTWHISVSLGLLLIGFIFIKISVPTLLPFILLIGINIYVFSFSFLAAVHLDGKSWFSTWLIGYFPTRVGSFVIFTFLLFATAILFASIYLGNANGFSDSLCGELDALYYSLMTITTMGVEGIAPQSTEVKRWVVFEVLTSINFFLGAFALLISRISNF